MQKEQYNNIDFFKLVFAIVVVMIHTTPFMDISEMCSWYFSNTIANLAVPFFFITSGFLLFGKLANCQDNVRNEAVKKYLAHIVTMYLIWCVIWIPWVVLNYHNIGSFGIIDLIKYLRDIIFVGGGDALWYLPALASGVTIVYLLRYKINVPQYIIMVFSLVLYIVGCLISSWYGFFETDSLVNGYYATFKTTDNGVLTGMIFLATGMLIAEIKEKSKPVIDVVCFVISFVLLCIESYAINKAGINKDGVCNNIMSPIVVFFMFKLILAVKLEGKEALFKAFRDYSTIIYLCHCFIIRSIKMLLGIVGLSISRTLLFIIVLTLSLGFAVCVRKMSKRYTWCKLLY